MPNLFAYVMLSLTPIWVMLAYPRFRPARACAVLALAGLVLLPEKTTFKVSGVPELDKEGVLYASLFLATVIYSRSRWRAMRLEWVPRALLLLLVVGCSLTVLTNMDPLPVPEKIVPGHSPKDILLWVGEDALLYIIPFVIGRMMFRTPGDLRALLVALALAGLLCALPILFEVRMSPQLHNMLYGFHQNNFAKNYRWGGFRPILFMRSGLAMGVFMVSTAVAAATLFHMRARRAPGGGSTLLLSLLIVACKSTGSIVYGMLFVPLAAFASIKNQRRALMFCLALTATYPFMRTMGSGPTDLAVEFFRGISTERAQSLLYRFDNENAAMRKVEERFFFGWGTYSRNRVYDEMGKFETVYDAFWMRIMTQRGLVGWLTIYSLLAFPLFKLIRTKIPLPRHRVLAHGFGIVLAVRLLDLMQNGFYTSFVVLMAGALLGALPALSEPTPTAAPRDCARSQFGRAAA